MFSFFSEFASAQKIVSKKFDVIFFAESRHYFQYFKHLFDALVEIPNVRIAYITSDKTDEILNDNRIEAFYLKSTLAGIFPRLQAGVVIMTMPDLQNFIFKKSPTVNKYVYVFHALVSTHQQYRSGAFDHYDTIFCTGPQQEAEIRESEKLYSLPAKEIVRYGYPLLHNLKEEVSAAVVQQNKILIAPSWYKEGILTECILPLIGRLTLLRRQIWIRPHPEFVKRNKEVYRKLLEMIDPFRHIQIDSSSPVFTHATDAQLLITDRSGIALEYAFATQRPVLFIDTPLKIQNPNTARFDLEPVENSFRKMLGISIAPNELDKLGEAIKELEEKRETFATSILRAESEVVFPATYHLHGVQHIKQLLQTV